MMRCSFRFEVSLMFNVCRPTELLPIRMDVFLSSKLLSSLASQCSVLACVSVGRLPARHAG